MTQLRLGDATDLDFLKNMLFGALFWDPETKRPSFASFCGDAEFTKLFAGWGRTGDRAVIAQEHGVRLGSAWFRFWTPESHSYGFVDARTPKMAIAVRPDSLSRGVGYQLLNGLVQQARADGYPSLSLSVSPKNSALRLYESAGFRKVGESGTSWTLSLSLSEQQLECTSGCH